MTLMLGDHLNRVREIAEELNGKFEMMVGYGDGGMPGSPITT